MAEDKQAQRQKLVDYLVGYQATWIAHTGRRVGLFAAIAAAGDGIQAADLAARLGVSPRYLSVWCRAAYACELLDFDAARGYRLAPHMAALLLDPSDPLYLGGRLDFYVAIGEDFAVFPERLAGLAERNPILATALAPSIGYEASARIAQEALASSRGVFEVARERTSLGEAQLRELLDTGRMTG